MPVGPPFKPGQSGNPAGLPKGYVSLSTRIQRILEGDEKFPTDVQVAITKLTGDSKKPTHGEADGSAYGIFDAGNRS